MVVLAPYGLTVTTASSSVVGLCRDVTVTHSPGFTVLIAANPLQALARLDEAVPDLILLDITMPHMDGFQLCKLIKANPQTAGVPVVMLSGKDGLFDKVRGRLAGAVDHVAKPFDPAVLVQAVERHCRPA